MHLPQLSNSPSGKPPVLQMASPLLKWADSTSLSLMILYNGLHKLPTDWPGHQDLSQSLWCPVSVYSQSHKSPVFSPIMCGLRFCWTCTVKWIEDVGMENNKCLFFPLPSLYNQIMVVPGIVILPSATHKKDRRLLSHLIDTGDSFLRWLWISFASPNYISFGG